MTFWNTEIKTIAYHNNIGRVYTICSDLSCSIAFQIGLACTGSLLKKFQLKTVRSKNET